MAAPTPGGTGKALDELMTKEETAAFYENVSDRSSALVLANIVENRLTEALKLIMRDDKPLVDELFNPSGPLGAYGTKIRLAYMLRMLAPETYKDLMIIGRIRNKFAHDLSVTSFDNQQIHDWIKNMHIYGIVKTMTDQGRAAIEAHEKGAPRYTTADYVKSGFMTTAERTYRNCLRFIIHHIIDYEMAVRAAKPETSPSKS